MVVIKSKNSQEPLAHQRLRVCSKKSPSSPVLSEGEGKPQPFLRAERPSVNEHAKRARTRFQQTHGERKQIALKGYTNILFREAQIVLTPYQSNSVFVE